MSPLPRPRANPESNAMATASDTRLLNGSANAVAYSIASGRIPMRGSPVIPMLAALR